MFRSVTLSSLDRLSPQGLMTLTLSLRMSQIYLALMVVLGNTLVRLVCRVSTAVSRSFCAKATSRGKQVTEAAPRFKQGDVVWLRQYRASKTDRTASSGWVVSLYLGKGVYVIAHPVEPPRTERRLDFQTQFSHNSAHQQPLQRSRRQTQRHTPTWPRRCQTLARWKCC